MNTCAHCGKSTTNAVLCSACQRTWQDTTLVVGSFTLKYATRLTGKNPQSILIEHDGEQMTVETTGQFGLEEVLRDYWAKLL